MTATISRKVVFLRQRRWLMDLRAFELVRTYSSSIYTWPLDIEGSDNDSGDAGGRSSCTAENINV